MKYSKRWYISSHDQCFFCFHFHSIHHTKAYILKRIKWYFDTSSENSQIRFYQEYLELVNQWCDHFEIKSTNDSILLERLLKDEIIFLKNPIVSQYV